MGFKYLFGRTLKGSADDADRLAIKDSTVGAGNPDRNMLLSTLRDWLASKIASGDMLLNPRSFTSGRFDSN